MRWIPQCGHVLLALTTVIVTAGLPAVGQERERESARPNRESAERDGDREAQRDRQIAAAKERLQQLERQIKELREAGRLDAAEERIREFNQLRERLAAVQRGQGREAPGQRELPAEARERLEQLKRRHAELREAGKIEEAEAVEREARAILGRFQGNAERRDRGERGPNEIAQRLQHLRAAIEHLRAAGQADLAEETAARISRLERELGERREGDRREGERREGERREGDRREGDARDRRDREAGERDRPAEERRGERAERPDRD